MVPACRRSRLSRGKLAARQPAAKPLIGAGIAQTGIRNSPIRRRSGEFLTLLPLNCCSFLKVSHVLPLNLRNCPVFVILWVVNRVMGLAGQPAAAGGRTQ